MNALRIAALAACVGATACADPKLDGTWEVVEFKRPGISAMGDLDAALWLGRTLVVTDSTATMAGERCAVARVTRETLPVRSIEMGFNVMAGDLGIAKERTDLLEIECARGDLGAGKRLIRLAPDTLMTWWDGVFFVLARRRGPPADTAGAG
jgi:hypothetical protein